MQREIEEFGAAGFSLEGKVAFVTGGNKGIGQAISVALARFGARLFVTSRSSEGRDELARVAEAAGTGARFCTADSGERSELRRAVDECLDAYGCVDILVNNAGIQRRASVTEFPDQDWDEVLGVNLTAAFFLMRELGKAMAARGSGKIINIASLLSFQGGLRVPAYAAAKHGILGLTRAFSNELAARNVQVNAIAPGYVDTEMNAALMADAGRSGEILARIPAGRWAKPADFMGAAVFLASRASDYVTGQTIFVDGGWMAR